MDIKNTRFSSIEQITGQYLNNRNVRQTDKENVSSFDTILKQKFDDAKTEGLKFSKHAMQRLADRNIDLSNEQLDRLDKGVKLSVEKGIRESLVLMDDYAFIINTSRYTVITAMEQGNEGDNVFTNIDGAVWYRLDLMETFCF